MKRKRSCPVCRDEIKEEDAKAIVRNPSLQVSHYHLGGIDFFLLFTLPF